MKKIKLIFVALFCISSFAANADPIYVGSYEVNDGPIWTSNPAVYSATEAAAIVFGGVAADYFISILSSLDFTTITHTGWYDGWGEHNGMIFNENYSLDLGAPGYADPGGRGTARSAWVRDGLGDRYVNYVWTSDNVVAVPEPGTLTLFGLGLLGMGLARRKVA